MAKKESPILLQKLSPCLFQILPFSYRFSADAFTSGFGTFS
jgi:hypothetical protein